MAHAVQYNEELIQEAETSKARPWSRLELLHLAQAEAEYEGRAIDMDLAVRFDRTADSVKYQRKQQSYKDLLTKIQADYDEATSDEEEIAPARDPVSPAQAREPSFYEYAPETEEEQQEIPPPPLEGRSLMDELNEALAREEQRNVRPEEQEQVEHRQPAPPEARIDQPDPNRDKFRQFFREALVAEDLEGMDLDLIKLILLEERLTNGSTGWSRI